MSNISCKSNITLAPFSLVDAADQDVEILEPEELDGTSDNRPHLVFLIPGIRTNGWWAQELKAKELLWDGREVHFIPVRGNGGGIGRLSSIHLVSRLGLNRFKTHITDQINDIASKNEYYSINVFAHSMGSSLFAELVEHWPYDLFKENKKFGVVAFVGGVCHRRHSKRLHKYCKTFVNLVGTNDYYPYFASIVRPDAYSDVGLFGFLDGFSSDQFYDHDHRSCTSFEHIKSEILPLISDSEVRTIGSDRAESENYNKLYYIRAGIWVFIGVILHTIYLYIT